MQGAAVTTLACPWQQCKVICAAPRLVQDLCMSFFLVQVVRSMHSCAAAALAVASCMSTVQRRVACFHNAGVFWCGRSV